MAGVDIVLCASNLSLGFGENRKTDEELNLAWQDLRIKLAGGFPRLFYGQIPYLILWAAAGSRIQFGLLRPNGQVGLIIGCDSRGLVVPEPQM